MAYYQAAVSGRKTWRPLAVTFYFAFCIVKPMFLSLFNGTRNKWVLDITKICFSRINTRMPTAKNIILPPYTNHPQNANLANGTQNNFHPINAGFYNINSFTASMKTIKIISKYVDKKSTKRNTAKIQMFVCHAIEIKRQTYHLTDKPPAWQREGLVMNKKIGEPSNLGGLWWK